MTYYVYSKHIPIRYVNRREHYGIKGVLITVYLDCGHYLGGNHAKNLYVDDQVECRQCAIYILKKQEWLQWKSSGLDVAEWVAITPRQVNMF